MKSHSSLPIWIRDANGMAFSDIPVTPGGRMPDFCIIGAAKGGTTALNAMLDAQPFVFMNPLKEPHYFSTPELLERGDDWYRGLYAGASEDQILGEASTSYTRYPLVAGTAERMAAANPQMKLIYVLRNPVARAQSECLQTMKYAHRVLKEDHTHKSLDDFFREIEQPEHPYYADIVATSTYIDQIDAFRKVFDLENILILMQEDIRTDPKGTLSRICDFLGVDSSKLVDTDLRANVTAEWQEALSYERVETRFSKIPFYRTLKAIAPAGLKSYLLRKSSAKKMPTTQKFSPALKADLADIFREPNRRLSALIGPLPEDWPQ